MKFLPLLLLLSCHSYQVKEPISYETEALKTKYELYLNLQIPFLDNSGFLPSFGCDQLLFVSLDCHKKTVISDAEGEPGQWFRNPDKTCFDRGASQSDISRDMLLGLAHYALCKGDNAIIERTLSYGSSHEWIMGRGLVSRTFFTDNMKKTYALISKYLGGIEHKDLLGLKDFWSFGQTGYEAHLVILQALARSKVGNIDQSLRERIEEQYSRQPDNALFSFAHHKFTDGNYAQPIEQLMDETHFPSDSLPTSLNQCTDYLWSQENWVPCDENKTHPGVDFVFVARLILEEING